MRLAPYDPPAPACELSRAPIFTAPATFVTLKANGPWTLYNLVATPADEASVTVFSSELSHN